ncbi:mechanosensitive ion channel family protein [Demequina aurantiaca]|uniref:mechanosensitive ion channel family protein n=1 Tax=Demequina aurantiaca TaxID=676200 RepID=UPI0007850847|nr:mechanosensitive ion channel family protein [Demequina aurantiaca]
MLLFATETCPESDPDCNPLGVIENFFADAAYKTVNFGITLLIVLILWVIARRIVKSITRSIEEGTPLQNRKTRKALAKARIKIPDLDTTEARLEAERRRQRAHTIRTVLNSAVTVVAIVIVAVSLLTVLGIPVGPLLASAGVAGVALGFGAQSLVKDVLSGIFMLLEDQYGVGDIVDVGEAIGTVEEVGLRSTRLRSIDGTVWYVPNGEIRRVGNMTRLWSRVMIEVRFSYDTDIDSARQAMLDAVASARSDEEIDQSILSEPEVPGIESFEFNAFMLRLMVQVNPATQWDVQRAIRRQMRAIFARRGLRLAVPDQAMIYDNDSKISIGQDVLADEYAAIDDADAAAAEKKARGTDDAADPDATAVPKAQGDKPGASGRNIPAGDDGGDE